MFVLVWGGFRGAVTLSLGLLATDAGGVLANYDAEVSSKVVFHSAGIVAFTNIFNASTMRYLLSKIGKSKYLLYVITLYYIYLLRNVSSVTIMEFCFGKKVLKELKQNSYGWLFRSSGFSIVKAD